MVPAYSMQIQSTPLNIVYTVRPVSNCAKIVSLFEVYMLNES